MSSKVWYSNEIRQQFLSFFQSKLHHIVPSAPIVLKNDPSLLFTNAGMNQFKDYFLGYKSPENKRVADSQKCLRVSGKHNDLEDVGKDTYHHTMFEMLGNWSFGDYFKKEAIAWSWELLTEQFQISKDRVYVTIFEGHEADGLQLDQEAFDCWKEWIAEDRILNGSKKDNFWEMGDTGPCGPCSEIHIDLRSDEQRSEVDGKSLVNQDHPEVVEVWNLVFMQYNRKADGSLEHLEQSHIDTGMGFERLCMVLQNKNSTYDTDLFSPLIEHIEQESGMSYTREFTQSDIAIRVIVDHIRAISFAIADGQLPSNSGAGYVIRRILRRAVRYGYSFLGFDSPFLFSLVSILAKKMGDAYPELVHQEHLIETVIREEEQSFLRTLDSGLKKMDQFNSDITGEEAFQLYDTYGFPLDLTKLIASERGLKVDETGFDAEMAKQRKRAQKDAKMEIGDWTILQEGNTHFVGYDLLEAPVQVLRYRSVLKKDKEIYQLVFDQTPFYAESGGQVGDSGVVDFPNETIAIYDTKKENDLIIHFAKSLPKDVTASAIAKVNLQRRKATEKNHSATHLLHAALRQVLGSHVEQKGSLVNAEKLRFDFSHFSKMNKEQLDEVESIVNEKIALNIPKIEQREVAFDDAVEQGATALFGEKYGEQVRVITFDPGYSVELCGGNHVNSTAEIQVFKILSETAISAGIRRIEAVTALEAIQYYKQKEETINEINELLQGDKNVLKSVQNLVKNNVELSSKLKDFSSQQAVTVKNQLKDSMQQFGSVQFIGEVVQLDNSDSLKNIAFELRNELVNLVLVIGAEINDKPILGIMISDNLVENHDLDASKMVRELAKEIKGGGGGQPFYATAGGKDATGLSTAIEMARSLVSAQFS